jgi:alpha-galactosidase
MITGMRSCARASPVALAFVTAALCAQAPVVRLESLELSGVEQDWGSARAAQSVGGHPLRIGGKEFAHGVGTHAHSEAELLLDGGALRFCAEVGVDDEPCGGKGSVVFVVHVDDREALRTPVLRLGDPAQHVDVPLAGAKRLLLVVEDGGDGINYDHADWADARIELAAADSKSPRIAAGDDLEPALAPAGDPPQPRIHWPRITGGSPGKPFLFRIPATGRAPLRFEAKGLPAGLQLDADRGIVHGVLAAAGRTEVEIVCENADGRDARTLVIVSAPDAVAQTPPMGWNSWNCWALAVDDGKVRAAADAFVQRQLAAHGYSYINIDDGWEAGRDAEGRILANERFPDMKALCDHVHGRGLKLGIYSSPGPKTCGGFTGSWQHEAQDAQRYAEWGIDYLKYDWCSYGEIAPHPDRAALQKPYSLMRDALRAGPRDVVFSLCQYGMGNVWEWGKDVGGNCWRTTGDITDSWSSMAGIGFAQARMQPFSGPGHWNDPDMLVVGRVGWGPNLHPTRLTHNEQVTHLTLWSMLAAPLLLGCDLAQLDAFTLALLTNDDVLAIDQDAVGKPAQLLWRRGTTEVWTRPLADGTTAVALCNRGRAPAEIAVTWRELGFDRAPPVRDCWRREDMRTDGPGSADGWTQVVGRHGAALLRLGAIRD